MTDRQQKFADEYIIDCNATRAYKAAYPMVKKDAAAAASGSRLLKDAKIKAYIEEKLAEISSRKTAEAAEAKIIEKPPDEKERLKAAELLGKRYGLFTDKVAVEGAVPVVISGGDRLED